MPPAPAECHGVGLSKDDFATSPADADAVQPFLAVGTNDAALKTECVRRAVLLSPTDCAQKSVWRGVCLRLRFRLLREGSVRRGGRVRWIRKGFAGGHGL